MSTMEVTTRITHKYLMRKSKWELADWILRQLDEQEALNTNLKNATEALEFISEFPFIAGNPAAVSAFVIEVAKKTLRELKK